MRRLDEVTLRADRINQLSKELEEIKADYEDFGPKGFYRVPFKKFSEEFPVFTKDIILSYINEMEIRDPEEMADIKSVETDWATGELIISDDWECLLYGAELLINGRGPKSKHQFQWEKIWKKFYQAFDEE